MRSPLLLLFLILFGALSGCNTTERVVDFTPDAMSTMQPANVDIASLRSTHGNVDGVYLKYDQTLEHNVSIAFTSTIPHWKFYHIVDRSRMVLNPAAPEMATFRLELPPNTRLEQALLRVQSVGSTGIAYTAGDLLEETGPEGQTIYTFNYPNVAEGTIIHESYELNRTDLERDPPVLHDLPLQYDLPTESLTFQYIYPIWWQVRVKDLSMNQPLNYERIEDAERRKIILRYADQNVPAFTAEANGPYFKQAAPYFQLQVTNMSMGSALRYRAAEDWTEFAKDYRKYAVDPNARLSRSIKKTSDQLIGFKSTNQDRVETLLNYFVDNIRLNESGKQRSHDAVLDRGEGNAYMVTGLMQAMLRTANIDSEYLLVHPAFEGYFDPEFYSDVQLREPALGVFVDGEQYYVLPGRQRSLTEAIPPYYAGQTAMVITSEGFGGFTEVFSNQVTGAPAPIAIADRGSLGNNASQNAVPPASDPTPTPVNDTTPPPVTQQDIDPAPANPPPQTNTDNGSLTPPVPTGGGVVGSPIGNQPVNAQPPPPEPEPAVTVVTDPAPAADALPEWVGSIKRNQGGWTWVVASRTTLPDAEEVANSYIDLYRQGISVDVLAGQSNGVTRYRIAIGQYSTRNLAESDRSRLGTALPSDAWMLKVEANM